MNHDPITWQRLRAIFGDPPLVMNVTQRQFDYNDDKLIELGRTPYDEIESGDLWYYHHDLAYVKLQPDLFAHMFPVCLMDWHRSLLANQPCSHGDSEFHYGIIQGGVLAKMLSQRQREEVEAVFRDSVLFRLDQERGFFRDGMNPPAYGWLFRLNSLGLFSNELPSLWQTWWKVRTPGRAVAILQYCSGLMYFHGENPLFENRTCDKDGGGPYLWKNDSMVFHCGWPSDNISFIRQFLTKERVVQAVQDAAEALQARPDAEIASTIVADVDDRLELIESRIAVLPELLGAEHAVGWTV